MAVKKGNTKKIHLHSHISFGKWFFLLVSCIIAIIAASLYITNYSQRSRAMLDEGDGGGSETIEENQPDQPPGSDAQNPKVPEPNSDTNSNSSKPGSSEDDSPQSPDKQDNTSSGGPNSDRERNDDNTSSSDKGDNANDDGPDDGAIPGSEDDRGPQSPESSDPGPGAPGTGQTGLDQASDASVNKAEGVNETEKAVEEYLNSK